MSGRASRRAPREWFVVDLCENAAQAGTSRRELAAALVRAMQRHTFDRERLSKMAKRFSTKATLTDVESALGDGP